MNVTQWLKVLSTPQPKPAKKMLGPYELVTEEDVSRHRLYSAAFVGRDS
jgi:hypothetical protein